MAKIKEKIGVGSVTPCASSIKYSKRNWKTDMNYGSKQ